MISSPIRATCYRKALTGDWTPSKGRQVAAFPTNLLNRHLEVFRELLIAFGDAELELLVRDEQAAGVQLRVVGAVGPRDISPVDIPPVQAEGGDEAELWSARRQRRDIRRQVDPRAGRQGDQLGSVGDSPHAPLRRQLTAFLPRARLRVGRARRTPEDRLAGECSGVL